MLQRRWLILSLALALVITCVTCAAAAAASIETTAEATISANSAYVLDGQTITDRRTSTDCYASAHLPGSSAIYAKNGARPTFTKAIIVGNGILTDADLSKELASKYGYSAAVLVYGAGTTVRLVNPTITTATDSNANGGIATCGAKLIITGGSITTDNRLGHGLDATYQGNISASNITIHTSGGNSGALATDFGGGFITVHDIHATTEVAGSPGIYCAGMSVIRAYDSTFDSRGCEAVMVAHDRGHCYLYNCTLTGTVGLNGHNSMSQDYSFLVMRQGVLNSTSGALVTEAGGKTDVTLVHVTLGKMGNGVFIDPASGRLVITLDDMTAAAPVTKEAKSYLEVNLKNTDLNASVTATKLTVDSDSTWKVAGASSVVNLTIASIKAVTADHPVTVTFNTMTLGGRTITSTYAVGNVTFVQSSTLVDDYEAPAPAGPPASTGGTGGGRGSTTGTTGGGTTPTS